jgi:alpha-glucosidase (family GH31 glycosyl hydrolase)
MPLLARAGAILPLGPVKQFVDEQVDEPLAIHVFPGANGAFTLYEDDGRSFGYERGEWTGLDLAWNDRRRRLSMRLTEGSRMIGSSERGLRIRLAGSSAPYEIVFRGRPIEVTL